MSIDEYITTIGNPDQVQELLKIKQISDQVDPSHHSLEHICLISSILKRPIEIFIQNSLHYVIGSEYSNDAKDNVIQIEKILSSKDPKWRKLTGIYYI